MTRAKHIIQACSVLVFLAVCATINSCSRKLSLPSTLTISDQLIEFEEPVVKPATKAGSASFSNSDFVVSAKRYNSTWVSGSTTWTAGIDYMNEVVINNPTAYNQDSRTGWAGAFAYFWPKYSYLAFQAYSPSACGATIDGNGISFPSYTVATDGTQADLMYSDRVVDKNANVNIGSQYYGVQLTFHHILSAITFSARTKEDYGTTMIRIQDIKISGLYTQGDFAQNLSDDGSSNGTPAWTNIIETPMADGTYYANPVIDEDHCLSNDAATSNANFSPIYVLPQDFTTNDNAKLHIVYIVQVPGGAATQRSIEQKLNALTFSNENGYHFYMGKRYIFNIVIGLSPIHFTPQCFIWTEEELEGTISDY